LPLIEIMSVALPNYRPKVQIQWFAHVGELGLKLEFFELPT